MTQREVVPAAATWGLAAAFAVHDLEELLTMPGWAARRVPALRRRWPGVPARVWSAAAEVTPAHAALSIGLVGLVVGAAAAHGARTGGRSAFNQTVLAGFGLHAVTHVAQSVAVRGYTPGVLTAPVVVAPYSLWAWRRLGRAGVRREVGAGAAVAGAALAPVAILGAHALAYGLRRLARRVTTGS